MLCFDTALLQALYPCFGFLDQSGEHRLRKGALSLNGLNNLCAELIWGQRRRHYLKEHHKILYYNLLTQCKLIDHLADINEEAQNMYDRLVKQLAEQEGVIEKLKGEGPLGWVAKMNNINSRAREIVFVEIIYTV